MKLKKKLLTAAICLALGTGHAMAMPTGGSIVAGGDNIKNFVENPASGAVIDFTGNGVINWNAFNIGTNEAMTFNVAQNAMAFNYVSGGDISTILGHLTQSGGGSMVLCNPNGIVVGNGAVINANDLTMMTMQLNNDQLENIFTNAGSSILANVGSEGRIAIADGVYISSGAYISSDDDGVHISSGADVRKDSVASRSVSSFSARPAGAMMASAYSDSNEDSAGEELPPVNWVEIISANPYDGEMRAVIRQYLNAGYTAEDLTKQLDSLNISLPMKSLILAIILQSQESSAEADTQVKNMSAFTEANNLSKAESASTRKSLRIPHKDKAKVVGKELRTPDYIKNGFKLTSENTKKLGLASVADDKKLEQIVNEMKEMLNSQNTSSTSNTTTASSGEEGTDASSGNKEVGGALVVNGGTLSIGSEKMNEPLRAGKRIVLDGDEKTGASLTWTDASSIGGEKTDNILVAAANALGGTLSIGSEKMNEPLRAGKLTVSLGDEKIDTSLQSNLTVGSLTNRDRLFVD